jgi:hypothetical protein
MLLYILIILSVLSVQSFKWHLKDTLPSQKVLTFSERYMFSTENGPPMLEQGAAYIHIDANAMVYMKVNQSAVVSFAVFAASEDHHHDSLIGMCDQKSLRDNYWASNIYVQPAPTKYVGTVSVTDLSLGLNGTYYLWSAPLVTRYSIRVEEWHNVAFQVHIYIHKYIIYEYIYV